MKVWVFSTNFNEFNDLSLCLRKNNEIDLSVIKETNNDSLEVGDELFIWGSRSKTKSDSQILARSKVVSIIKTKKITIRIKILEEDLNNEIKIRDFNEKKYLHNLISSNIKNKLMYLLSREDGSYLRGFWYSHYAILKEELNTRFSLVDSLEDIKTNMKKFELDLTMQNELKKDLPRFQQWYYIHEGGLIAPSKFIGYKNMDGILYTDKNAIAWTDGRDTEHRMSRWFIPYENKNLENHIREYFGTSLRKTIKIKVLKKEINIIEEEFGKVVLSKNGELGKVIDLDIEAEKAEEGYGIEGSSRGYYGKRYERNARNRMLAIQEHGLNCKVCNFNFESMYGERGKDFIEIHHIKPLNTLKKAMKINPKTELIPLCSNCHRMIHRRKNEVLTIEELSKILEMNKIKVD